MVPEAEEPADIQSNTEPDPPYVVSSTCWHSRLVQLLRKSLTCSRFLYDSLVTVLVGSQETRFDLHRGLLCASSDFFRAAITGDFKERDQNKIKLPKQDVKIFKFFVRWLYTGRLRGFYYPATMKPSLQELRQAAISELKKQNLDVLQDLGPDNPKGKALYMAHYRDAPFSHLVGLYILADTLLVHDLKDRIITLIIDVYAWSERDEVAEDEANARKTQHEGEEADEAEARPSDSATDELTRETMIFWSLERPPGLEDPCKGINMAWEALPRHSPLCQLIVECFCDNITLVEEYTNKQQYHPGFVAAVAQNYAMRLERLYYNIHANDWDQKGQICKFHEHSAASECRFAKRNVLARNPHKRAKRARNEK